VERGYNAFYLTNAANAWIRDVEVINADNAVMLNNVDFTTVERIVTGVTQSRRTQANHYDGHHGVSVNYGNDILVRDFDMRMQHVHDTAVRSSAHVVYHRGRGEDLVMDGHRTAPWGTLWASVHLGKCSPYRVYATGGSTYRGFPMASKTTYYNLTCDSNVVPRMPPSSVNGPCTWSTFTNFIGRFSNSNVCPQYWVYKPLAGDLEQLPLPQAAGERLPVLPPPPPPPPLDGSPSPDDEGAAPDVPIE
jgi:hypothetical protein